MSKTIQPIPTVFDGVRYRSRLEARWAMFFKEVGIPAEYEAMNSNTALGTYTPDLFLPLGYIAVEIKPIFPAASYFDLLRAYVRENPFMDLLVVIGKPAAMLLNFDPDEYPVLQIHADRVELGRRLNRCACRIGFEFHGAEICRKLGMHAPDCQWFPSREFPSEWESAALTASSYRWDLHDDSGQYDGPF